MRHQGIAVTLEDMVEIKEAVKKKPAPGDATDFSGGAHMSMRCHDFLKILNAKLEQSGAGGFESGGDGSKKAQQKHGGKGKDQGKKGGVELTSTRVRGIERRHGGLQLMSVLGITDSCLSR